ncbi:hypothetical protein L3Y34_015384 [Caenorhabditis briggsae]|nr:hypothetical protein L3Y34_015384 [Caenorhabditis briggsae]
MKGSTIGTETKECGKETDFCYNGTADISSFSKFQKAGCNTVICQFHANKCFDQNVSGQQLTFCCCNTGDLCNGGAVTDSGSLFDRGLSVLKGLVSAGKKR